MKQRYQAKEVVADKPSKEVMPSKSGVLKRLQKMSNKQTSPDDSQTVRKAQVTSKGVIVREILAPVSPSSKKKKSSRCSQTYHKEAVQMKNLFS